MISSGLCKATPIRLLTACVRPGALAGRRSGRYPKALPLTFPVGRAGFCRLGTTESIDRFSSAVYDRCTINPVVLHFRCFWTFLESISCAFSILGLGTNPTLTASFSAVDSTGWHIVFYARIFATCPAAADS